MLSKEQRLSRALFAETMRYGRRKHSRSMTIIFYPIPEGAFAGGAVVSKKVAKKATDRHRLRRRVYGVLRSAQKELKGLRVIVVLNPQASLASYTTLRDELYSLLDTVALSHHL
jgi:ribonuclease P protein component